MLIGLSSMKVVRRDYPCAIRNDCPMSYFKVYGGLLALRYWYWFQTSTVVIIVSKTTEKISKTHRTVTLYDTIRVISILDGSLFHREILKDLSSQYEIEKYQEVSSVLVTQNARNFGNWWRKIRFKIKLWKLKESIDWFDFGSLLLRMMQKTSRSLRSVYRSNQSRSQEKWISDHTK